MLLLHWHLCLRISTMHSCIINTDGWVQDCSNSSALAMELLQFCTKPSIQWLLSDTQHCSVYEKMCHLCLCWNYVFGHYCCLNLKCNGLHCYGSLSIMYIPRSLYLLSKSQLWLLGVCHVMCCMNTWWSHPAEPGEESAGNSLDITQIMIYGVPTQLKSASFMLCGSKLR